MRRSISILVVAAMALVMVSGMFAPQAAADEAYTTVQPLIITDPNNNFYSEDCSLETGVTPCRKTPFHEGGNGYFLGARVPDTIISADDLEISIRVTYLDQGTDTFTIQYRNEGAIDNLYKKAEPVQKTGNNEWKTYVFKINDAQLDYGGSLSTDLRIYGEEETAWTEYIQKIEVKRGIDDDQVQPGEYTVVDPLVDNNPDHNYYSEDCSEETGTSPCRKITFHEGGNGYFLGVRVPDNVISAVYKDISIRVTYLDQGTDTFSIQYRNVDAAANMYKKAELVQKTGTNEWKTYVFKLNDAQLDNGGALLTDFRIYGVEDATWTEYIQKIEVKRGFEFELPVTETVYGNVYQERGIYSLGDTFPDDPRYYVGQQIKLQWAEVEKTRGDFDWELLDQQLFEIAKRGKYAVIKLNANLKPDWLMNIVPYTTHHWDDQVWPGEEGQYHWENQEWQGQPTYMYWHPNHLQAYQELLAAYSDHIRNSLYKPIILGVRLNYDAIGEEHYIVPVEERDLSYWIVPDGVTQGLQFEDQRAYDYELAVTDAFVEDFSPDIKVFARTNFPFDDSTIYDPAVYDKYDALFTNGALGLFHTGAAMEENQIFNSDTRYSRFMKYTRPGKTYGFTENAGIAQKPAQYTEAQYMYWRILSDLNAGISYIAFHTPLLNDALTNTEVDSALQFAVKYAGFHAAPEVSPGAWVALRGEGDNYPGDYTFHMTRLPGGGLTEVKNVGTSQRFGAWAMSLPAGNSIHFDLSDDFYSEAPPANGYSGKVKVVYLDDRPGSWKLKYDGMEQSNENGPEVTMVGSGEWKTAEIPISDGYFRNRGPEESDLTLINSGNGDVIFHMIELVRE